MNARLRILALRAIPMTILAIVLTILVARSSLLKLLPFGGAAVAPYAFAALVVCLVPSLLAARSPMPATLAVVVPVLAAATYAQSRLDWLRLLRDFGVAKPGALDWVRLALALGALVVVWATHSIDTAARLRRSAVERGVAPAQAAAASRLSLQRSGIVTLLAVLATATVAGIAVLTERLDVGALMGGRASLFAPLIAVGLIALAAVLVAGGRADDGESRRDPQTRR